MNDDDAKVKAEARADLAHAFKYLREHLGTGNWFVRRIAAQMKIKTSSGHFFEM